MNKSVLVRIGIISLFALTSCQPKSGPVSEPVVPAPAAAVPEKIIATVTGDALRVREMPYLDAEIVGHLMTDDQVVVESRTEWSEIIGDLDSFWFFVRAESYSGWTYGGFLDFGDLKSATVAFDPGVSPPPTILPDPNEGARPGTIDPGKLPEILLPVFGLEEEPLVSNPKEGVITYDPFHEYLVLPYSGMPESKLRAFTAGEISSRLRLVADSSGNTAYEKDYGLGEFRLLSESSLSIPDANPEFSDAILIPFYRLATLDAGSWEIYAFIGEDNWPVAVGKVDISPSEVTIVPVSEPEPLVHSPRSQYIRGDTAYAFGIRKGGPGNLQVALYNDSGEYSGGKILLKPVSAVQLRTDSSGFWSARFYLGDDIPDGRCWAAVGDPIEGLENIRLFITSIEL
jgi:hypothetical protein